MSHGADISKMKPPVGYKNVSSLYNVEDTVINAVREQAEKCRLCLENQRVKIDDLMAKTLKQSPEFKKNVRRANLPCCKEDKETGDRCDTFERLVNAYAENIKSQGLTINVCKFCPAYIDNDPLGHGHKPCNGESEILDENGNPVHGECIIYKTE